MSEAPLILAIVTVAALFATRLQANAFATSSRRIGPANFDAAFVMRCVLSLVIVGAALYMILSGRYQSDSLKWAYGTIGTVLGYWLRG
jgi:hypothetical protein